MKTLLFILPSTSVGGAETRFHALIRHLKGVRSVLLTHSSVANFFSDLSLPLYFFDDYGGKAETPLAPRSIWGYVRAIRSVAKKEQVDLFFGVMHFGTLYASLAKDLFFLRQPLIGSILGHLSGYYESMGRVPSRLETALIRYLLFRPQGIVVSGKGVKNDLVRVFKARAESIIVIPNGMDLDRIRERAMVPLLDLPFFGGKTMVMSSRLCSGKDFETLLKALFILIQEGPVRLLLIGEGDYRDQIMAKANEIGVQDHLLLMGFRQNPFPYMKMADVFVLSSLHEGFGNVIVEAMALGVPVVATDCPTGPAEIIEDGRSGLLVEPQNAQKMADAIASIFDNKALQHQLSIGGLERATVFDVKTMVERYFALIMATLEHSRP